MGIDDRHKRALKTSIYCRRNRFTATQLFAYAFEDQNVGIDRHTNGQDYTSNSGSVRTAEKLIKPAIRITRLIIKATIALTPIRDNRRA